MLTYEQQLELHAKVDAIAARMRKMKYSRSISAAYRDTVLLELHAQESKNHMTRLEHLPAIQGSVVRAK